MCDTSRLPARWSCTLVLLAACACWTAPAHAWTRTHVEQVEAQLRVNAAAQAEVVMLLGVRVQGGWLSRFEVTGLDTDFALDPAHPPTLTAEDGSSYVPRVEAYGDGRAVLVFESRRSAPHRGLHRLRLAYATQLKANGKRVTWSLPPWGVDLEDVRVTVDAPAGATLGTQDEDDFAVQRERIGRDGRTQLSFRRAQLPRTLALAIAFELEHEVAAPNARAGAGVRADVAALEPPNVAVLWAGAFALVLCWLKRRAVHAMCARYRVRPLPLLRARRGVRACAMLALTLVFCTGYAAHASLALAALAAAVAFAFDRGFARAPKADTPAARSVARARPSAYARWQAWFGGAAWLDATTPLGFGLLGSAFALAALRLAWSARPGVWLEVLLVVTPLWLTSTRLHLPRARSARQAPAASTDAPNPAAPDTAAPNTELEAPPRSAGALPLLEAPPRSAGALPLLEAPPRSAGAPLLTDAPLRRAAAARPAPDRAA